jgi:hypothetical protein
MPRFLSATIVLLVAWWSNPTLSWTEYPDTAGYVALAGDLADEAARDRPPGYALFLRACQRAAGAPWPRMVVAVQMLSLAGLAVVLLGFFRRLGAPAPVAAPASILVCVNPGLLAAARNLLPELLLGLVLVPAWIASIHLAADPGPRSVRRAALLGVASGCAALIKPVWLLGALPLAAMLVLTHRRTPRRALAIAGALLSGHLLVCGAWQAFLLARFGQTEFSRVGGKNLNLALVRAGLAPHAEGSALYRHLEQAGLLQEAAALRWDQQQRFNRMKDLIPDDLELDPSFYRLVLRRCAAAAARLQLRRWPAFFSVRPPPLAAGSFPGLPRVLRYVYLGAYAWWFRADPGGFEVPTLLLLLLAAFGWCLRFPELRALAGVSAAAVVYFSGVVVALTYQDSLFIRMRAGLEPILLSISLIPICGVMARRHRARTPAPDPATAPGSPPPAPRGSNAPPAT